MPCTSCSAVRWAGTWKQASKIYAKFWKSSQLVMQINHKTFTYETYSTMNAEVKTNARRPWGSYILSGLAILFLLFDSIIKVLKLEVAVQGTKELGYPESQVVGIGLTALTCTILYAIPKTSVLGAILLSGYLGGAIATHVRLENPLFSHVLFPVYLAIFIWGGLYLRDHSLRLLIPLRHQVS